jgi:hypothetical protein
VITVSAALHAGVVVLSEEYMSAPLQMAQLQLLLERRSQGSRLGLLPMLYDVTCAEVRQRAEAYKAATGDPVKQQWAQDLDTLVDITPIPDSQVREHHDAQISADLLQ